MGDEGDYIDIDSFGSFYFDENNQMIDVEYTSDEELTMDVDYNDLEPFFINDLVRLWPRKLTLNAALLRSEGQRLALYCPGEGRRYRG